MQSSRSNDNRFQDPQISQAPDFNNLEIRGAWSGDPKNPVDIRISLEVREMRSC